MKTAKEVLDAIIIGMPDEDNMKRFIIMAMEEYAKLYHEDQLVDFLKHIKEVHTDEYGQLQICDNGDEYDPTVERVVKDYMKKSKNTISDWLDKYGDPEIDKKVEEELEHMKKYKVKLVILNENDEPQISSVFTSDLIDDMKTFHNISVLDEQLKMLLEQINNNTDDKQ